MRPLLFDFIFVSIRFQWVQWRYKTALYTLRARINGFYFIRAFFITKFFPVYYSFPYGWLIIVFYDICLRDKKNPSLFEIILDLQLKLVPLPIYQICHILTQSLKILDFFLILLPIVSPLPLISTFSSFNLLLHLHRKVFSPTLWIFFSFYLDKPNTHYFHNFFRFRIELRRLLNERRDENNVSTYALVYHTTIREFRQKIAAVFRWTK